MNTRTVRATSIIAMVTGATFALAGCGGGGNTGSAPSGASSAASSAPSSSVGGGATTVAVAEKEFSINLSRQGFKPGSYTFQVTNQGQFPHNLTVEGPGVDKKATATLQGGQKGAVTVTLQAGTYELWCSVDSHKAKGMDMKITVG